MKYLAIVLALACTSSYAEGWLTPQSVSNVSVLYGNGCIVLENNQVVPVDLESNAGRVEFSLALAEKTSAIKLKNFQT